MANLTYYPEVFDAADEDAARRIILTPEPGQETAERWERETPYMAGLIEAELKPRKDGLIVDYGCGLGRLAKVLIERCGCRVLGVDLSPRMRALAPGYVGSQMFSVVSPHMFFSLGQAGLRADGAFSVWVLQHCARPADDIGLISRALQPGGGLFVANMHARAIPTRESKWASDGVDVRALLNQSFMPKSEGSFDPDVLAEETTQYTYWASFAQPAAPAA